jgi:hypothetical protein
MSSSAGLVAAVMALLTWRTTPGEMVRCPSRMDTWARDGWVHFPWLPSASVRVKPAAFRRLVIFRVGSSLTTSIVYRARQFLVKRARQKR